MITVTKQMFTDHSTEKGSWTKAQVKALGIHWPPNSGWQNNLIGKTITPEAFDLFVKGKSIFKKSSTPTEVLNQLAIELEGIAYSPSGLNSSEDRSNTIALTLDALFELNLFSPVGKSIVNEFKNKARESKKTILRKPIALGDDK